MAGLTLSRLSKTYPGGAHALRPLDLEIASGELLTVVGPSGCGKSTLLRLLAGLEEETSGDMRLDGMSLVGLPPKQRDMALMFQNYALFPHLNLRENMAFGLRVRGMGRAQAYAEVEAVAAKLGLKDLLRRMPFEVSGGERQRAALGRALLRRPKVFLFDEPLSSLDAALRAQLRVEIGRLHRELSATMIFVTHDQAEALTLGDRVAVLRDGALQQIADPDTLYREPANRFVAGFIGNPGMSFLEGGLEKQGETWVFRHPDMTGPLALPAETVAAHGGLAARAPGTIALGLRPEDITLHNPFSGTALPGLGGSLSLAERLGGSTLLYLQGERAHFIAKVGGVSRLREQEKVIVQPDWSKARLFDAESGQAI